MGHVVACSRHADKAREATTRRDRDIHTDPLELTPRHRRRRHRQPPGAHHDLATAALAAREVLRKPFALDAARAVSMRDAAKSGGRR
jgi:hypothetical protein